MANISNILEEALLNYVFNGVAYSPPGNFYVALFDNTTAEADLEAGNITGDLATAEITGYTGNRKAATFTAATQVGGKATIENEGELEFEDMPAVTVSYAAVVDTEDPAGGGEILYWLVPPGGAEAISEGNIARIPAGDITIDLD